jgi:hypothetical protein
MHNEVNGTFANIRPTRISRRRLAFIRRRKTGDTIPFAIRPPKRAAAAPVSNCGKRQQRICRNVPPFDHAHLPPLVASPGGFSHGQALPLPFVTFLSPQSGRGCDTECPRHSSACWSWLCPVHDRAQHGNRPHPCPGLVRSRSVAAFSPWPQPRPQSVHVHKPSVSSPHPRRVHTRSRVNRLTVPNRWCMTLWRRFARRWN